MDLQNYKWTIVGWKMGGAREADIDLRINLIKYAKDKKQDTGLILTYNHHDILYVEADSSIKDSKFPCLIHTDELDDDVVVLACIVNPINIPILVCCEQHEFIEGSCCIDDIISIRATEETADLIDKANVVGELQDKLRSYGELKDKHNKEDLENGDRFKVMEESNYKLDVGKPEEYNEVFNFQDRSLDDVVIEYETELHDSHYKSENESMETIDIIERLICNGIPEEYHETIKRNYCVGQAFKYLDRQGKKSTESVDKELTKAENYIHRARTGKWL